MFLHHSIPFPDPFAFCDSTLQDFYISLVLKSHSVVLHLSIPHLACGTHWKILDSCTSWYLTHSPCPVPQLTCTHTYSRPWEIHTPLFRPPSFHNAACMPIGEYEPTWEFCKWASGVVCWRTPPLNGGIVRGEWRSFLEYSGWMASRVLSIPARTWSTFSDRNHVLNSFPKAVQFLSSAH